MKSHGKAGLFGVAAALVLLALPVEAEAKRGFGAVVTGAKVVNRATRSNDDTRAEPPTAPLANSNSPFPGKATAPSEPAAAAVTAKVEPLAAPNIGTVCLAGCYDAQGRSPRR